MYRYAPYTYPQDRREGKTRAIFYKRLDWFELISFVDTYMYLRSCVGYNGAVGIIIKLNSKSVYNTYMRSIGCGVLLIFGSLVAA